MRKVGVICLSAFLTTSVFAQVTVNVKQQTIKQALRSIEKVTDYRFFYSNQLPDLDKKVTFEVNNQSIEATMSKLLSGTGLVYEKKEDNQIYLGIKESKSGQKENKKITGTIVDDNGEPVIGANVSIKGSTVGTITDIDGNFSLDAMSGATLLISYIGYETQEITVSNQSVYNIKLSEDTQALDEVVVVGYGTQKKINLTGAVATVTPEDIQSRPITNVTQALQGVTPGLNITSSSKFGGEVGSPMDMNIRGVGSLTEGSGKPYVLVDGVPMELDLVNPNDIENISILKDASSAAIYGARAAYGVILVTTKSGSKDEKFTISYNANFGWKTPTMLQKTVNSLDFVTAMNDACDNAGVTHLYTDEMVELVKKNIASGNRMDGVIPDRSNPTQWGQNGDTYANTDWTDVYFKNWAFQNSHDVSITGRTGKSSYYAGLGYMKQEGQLNFFDENYRRYNVTVNNSTKLTPWLTFKLNSKFARSDRDLPVGYSGYDRTVNYHMIARAYPTLPVRNPNGGFMESNSVVQILQEGGSEKQETTTAYITPSFEINVLD